MCPGRAGWMTASPRSPRRVVTVTKTYIANMRNTATAGFKYFDCQGIRRISIRTKGYAKGCMEVRTAWDGPVLGTIPLAFANVWHDTAADIAIPDGVNALYFTFNGFGHLQFAAFNLMK